MKNKILFVVSILFGLLFANGGLNKLFHYIPEPTNMSTNMKQLMEAMLSITWLLPLVGIVEAIGGILCMIPRFRALGVVMLFPITVGILCIHTINEPSGLPMAIIILLIQCWMAYEERRKITPLFQA